MCQDFKKTLTWVGLATSVMGLALWQAQLVVTREQKAHGSMVLPPTKIRHAERVSARSRVVGDAVTNYLTRESKGLSDRELGWILDDFQTAGLDIGLGMGP